MNENIIAKATSEYRLCKKSNGELVLQRLYVEESDDIYQYELKEFWQDIETVKEDE